MYLELLFPFRNFYPLKAETSLVEKHLSLLTYGLNCLELLLDFTVHPKVDDAGLVDGAVCNYDGVWARSAVCRCASWIHAMAVIAKEKTISTIPWVNPLWTVV